MRNYKITYNMNLIIVIAAPTAAIARRKLFETFPNKGIIINKTELLKK